MDITGVGGGSSTQARQNIQRSNERLQTAIGQLVSGNAINRASDDVAALSIATQLQSGASSLRQASANISQASSLAQVADSGVDQIRQVLDRLNTLATQANSPVVNEGNREAINQEFQALLAEVDRLAESTSFSEQPLLDGSLSGDNSLSLAGLIAPENNADGEGLDIESLTTENLFEGRSLNLLSTESSTQASLDISNALDRVNSVQATIGSFQQSLNFAAANIESAAANQEAARSILQDTDFAQASTGFSLASVQRNAAIAVEAQGNRLSPNILKLIN